MTTFTIAVIESEILMPDLDRYITVTIKYYENLNTQSKAYKDKIEKREAKIIEYVSTRHMSRVEYCKVLFGQNISRSSRLRNANPKLIEWEIRGP